VHAVVLCASCSPLHCQALRARGKRALSRLTSRFRVASYGRRVDLVCDEQGIGGGSKHCDDNDARPDASAAETSTVTTAMHSLTAFHTASVAATCATLTRPRYAHTIINAHHVSVPSIILSRRCAPAASVQSSYVMLSGCQLLSQGPGVRLARHQRRRQVLRRQHGISGGGKHCDDSTASAAAESTATTTMHSPTHRRLRQALRIQRCITRPLFTRPA
jgi:hypothetical protein